MKIFGNRIDYAKSTIDCIKDADCCILVTEWDEYKSLSPEVFIKYMKTPILIDGRRVFDSPTFSRALRYVAIGQCETPTHDSD